MPKVDTIIHGKKVGEQEGEWYQLVQLCSGCIDDVLDGEIEFTIPTIINIVEIKDCDNLNVDNYDWLVGNRGQVLL